MSHEYEYKQNKDRYLKLLAAQKASSEERVREALDDAQDAWYELAEKYDDREEREKAWKETEASKKYIELSTDEGKRQRYIDSLHKFYKKLSTRIPEGYKICLYNCDHPGSLQNIHSFNVEQSAIPSIKPNGLWMSEGYKHEEGSITWIDWNLGEMPDTIDPMKCEAFYIIKIKDDKIINITNKDEFIAFENTYFETRQEKGRQYTGINWKKVADNYSGISISPYRNDMRNASKKDWYNGWDVSSQCIWNSDAIDSIKEINIDDLITEFIQTM
jgi:hypothetical protein